MLYERDEELRAVEGVVLACLRRRGAVCTVVGGAGLGKSAVLRHGRRAADRVGLPVLLARGSAAEQDEPGGLGMRLFEDALGALPEPERRAVLIGPASTAAAALAEGRPPAPTDLHWLTARLAEVRPLLLVVDDLHWADQLSLRFLLQLAARLDGMAVGLLAGWRPGEPTAATGLLDRLAGLGTACVLGPLTPAASTALLADRLERAPDRPFAAACHHAAGGNPLLLGELAEAVRAERLDPDFQQVGELPRLGGRALGRWAQQRLRGLPATWLRTVEAVAVLDAGAGGPDLDAVATVAGLPAEAVREALEGLARMELLRAPGPIRFAAPLIEHAVYDRTAPGRLVEAHRRAARLADRRAAAAGSGPEEAARHLLRTPAAGDPWAAGVLRRAGEALIADARPEEALALLRRAAAEPPWPAARREVLGLLGRTALAVDVPTAAADLRVAVAEAADPVERAEALHLFGAALQLLGRPEEAAARWTEALALLPPGEADLRPRLLADLVVGPVLGARTADPAVLAELRALPPAATQGGRALDCQLAGLDLARGDPRAVARARRGVLDRLLQRQDPAGTGVQAGWLVLVFADDPDVGGCLDEAVEAARRSGAPRPLAAALGHRACLRLQLGRVADAEADARESLRSQARSGTPAASARLPIASVTLAGCLLEQGRLDEAGRVLARADAGAAGAFGLVGAARARQLRLSGAVEEALAVAYRLGDDLTAPGRADGAVAWRAQAALCLNRLGRSSEAAPLAMEELGAARRWGVPRRIGSMLRLSGRVLPGAAGLELAEQAVEVLAGTGARLELAAALIDLGAALRRAEHRRDARERLLAGVALAQECGAVRVAVLGRAELAAMGGRPRRDGRPAGLPDGDGRLTVLADVPGPSALTPAERRVAELAARGRPNKEVAVELAVSVKTVETHLSRTYRKLGVASRTDLAARLGLARAED